MRSTRPALSLLLAGLAALVHATAVDGDGRAGGGGAGWSGDDSHPAAVCQLRRLEAGPGRPAHDGRRLPGSQDGTALAALSPADLPSARPPIGRHAPLDVPTAPTGRGLSAGRSCRGPPDPSASTNRRT